MSPLLRRALSSDYESTPHTHDMARNLYQQLRNNGCDHHEVLAICSAMVGELHTEMKAKGMELIPDPEPVPMP